MSNPVPVAPGLSVALPESALDMVPLGVAKVDRQQNLAYANRQLLETTGLPDWRGFKLADIFSNEDLDKVRAVLKERLEGVASEYRVELTRHHDKRKVPVSITSFPDTNEDNEVIGTLALVRDLTLEMAQKRMYSLVEQETETNKLLDAIADCLLPLVPFDRISVIRLNQDRTYLRTIYDRYIDRSAPPQTFRWWHIHPAVKDFLNSRQTLVIDDILRWYEEDTQRRTMLEDPIVQDFLREGFISTISLPVSQNDMQVASVVLYRTKEKGRFTELEQFIVEELPLAEAVSVAMRNETESDLNFLIDLMKLISSAYGSVRTVAQTIVDKITEHYNWDYVSIYQVYKQFGEIRLIAEKAADDERLEPEEMRFGIDKGVIGHVYRSGEAVNIGDLKSSEFKEMFIQRKGIETNSELCVAVGEDRHWLLNIEDKKTNAFAPEEMGHLKSVAEGLSSLLKRTLEYQYRSAVVERANDAIILTDVNGRILEVNPATAGLLGLSRDAIVGQSIRAFFADPENAEALIRGADFGNHESTMQRGTAAAGRDDRRVKVLLSVAQLPEEAGGKVFIASDMTHLQRIEQLELAQELHREVTAQIKTPMSLAISWLRRSGPKGTPEPESVPAKVIQQLQKAELTLDRLMLLELGDNDETHQDVFVSINDLLDGIVADMPARERKMVEVSKPDSVAPHIRADAYEVRYCLLTALSYLLRLAAEEDRIELKADVNDGKVAITLAGRDTTAREVGNIETECRGGQVRAELTLGRTTLARLAHRNQGEFAEHMETDGECVAMVFKFPLVSTGVRL